MSDPDMAIQTTHGWKVVIYSISRLIQTLDEALLLSDNGHNAMHLSGALHLAELMDIVVQGEQAAIVFIVQRPDAQRFSANWATDPEFAKTLARAAKTGVSVRAFACQVSLSGIEVSSEIHEVLL